MWRDPLDELIERLDNGLSTALPGDGCHSLPSFVELQWAVSRILDGIQPRTPLEEDPRFRTVATRCRLCSTNGAVSSCRLMFLVLVFDWRGVSRITPPLRSTSSHLRPRISLRRQPESYAKASTS